MYDFCCICGCEIMRGSLICRSCMESLENEKLDRYMTRCPICGYPLESNDIKCPWCTRNTGIKVSLISSYRAPWSRAVVRHWKFGGGRNLGKLISSFYLEEIDGIDVHHDACIVPVPCSIKSLKRRGWDQMADVAACLKRDIFPVLEVDSIYSEEQKKLDKIHRKESSEGKYMIGNKREVKRMLNRNVIIIDDIMTTGATIVSACNVLKAAGISNLHAVCWLWEP